MRSPRKRTLAELGRSLSGTWAGRPPVFHTCSLQYYSMTERRLASSTVRAGDGPVWGQNRVVNGFTVRSCADRAPSVATGRRHIGTGRHCRKRRTSDVVTFVRHMPFPAGPRTSNAWNLSGDAGHFYIGALKRRLSLQQAQNRKKTSVTSPSTSVARDIIDGIGRQPLLLVRRFWTRPSLPRQVVRVVVCSVLLTDPSHVQTEFAAVFYFRYLQAPQWLDKSWFTRYFIAVARLHSCSIVTGAAPLAYRYSAKAGSFLPSPTLCRRQTGHPRLYLVFEKKCTKCAVSHPGQSRQSVVSYSI